MENKINIKNWVESSLLGSSLVLWTKVASSLEGLNHPMLRLLSSKAQAHKDCFKPSKPCHIGIHFIAITEYSQITHVPVFQSFFRFLHHFVLTKLATSSRRVKDWHLKSFKDTIRYQYFLNNSILNYILK